MDIDSIREQIDQLDDQLLQIFNQRAALAVRIGEIKKQHQMAVYDPTREQRIFDRMQKANSGPLDNSAIVRLFEQVIDESRSLEHNLSNGA